MPRLINTGIMSHGKPALIFLLLLFAFQLPLKGEAASLNNTTNSSELNQAIELEDTSFRPDSDGFSFPNYGNELGIVGLTPLEMQRMFGNKVIVSIADGNIILTPQAKRWMNLANKAMAYGHCEGMAVLSDLIYYNKTNPMAFGGRTTINLSIQNELLQREIAYWWTTQFTHPGGSQKVRESPNAVLNTLAQAFKDGRIANEWWVMGLYQPDRSGGHSVTPFAVENLTNGTTRIWIYDNNFPMKASYVEIDRNANTWKYNGSINPNQPSELYAGNASTKSLEVVSVSSRLEPQTCEFCIGGSGSRGLLSDPKHTQIWTRDLDHVLITDRLGRRIGFTDSGIFVNEIPNAERLDLRLSDSKDSISKKLFVYDIPELRDLSVKFSSLQNQEYNNDNARNEEFKIRNTVKKPLTIGSISPRNYGTIAGIDTGSQNSGSNPMDMELWIIGPGFDVGMQNQGSEGFAELTWTGEGIAKLTFNNAMSGNLILGIGNTEFEVQNAPKSGILEMDHYRNSLAVTDNQPGWPISVHLEMDEIDENGEHRLADNVYMKQFDTIYFPDPCNGVRCYGNQHCENGACVDNPGLALCTDAMCGKFAHCENGKCISDAFFVPPNSGDESTNNVDATPILNHDSTPKVKDPCAGVSCGPCETCRNGACVWICMY